MTEKFQYIKEYLQTGLGTQGQLLITRKIHDVLIDEVFKKLIPRSEAAQYAGPAQIPGSDYNFNLVTRDSMDVREMGEGSGFVLDKPLYTNVQVTPSKYGTAIQITREMLEDAKWNLLQQATTVAARRLAENETALVLTALNTATNTITGGAAITVANITRGIQYLRDVDYEPTTMVIGPEVLNDLQNIALFAEAMKAGNTDMLDKGFLTNVFGLNVVLVSANTGTASTLRAWIFDNAHAYAIAEKRPVTVESFELPQYDMSAVTVSQRLAVTALRSEAICLITTT